MAEKAKAAGDGFDAASAGIGVGAKVLSGVMDAAAAAEERKKQMMMEAQKQQSEGASLSAQSLGSGQQRSFESLMSGYKSALLKR